MPLKYQTRPCSHCNGSGKEIDPVAVGKHMREFREQEGMGLREMATALSLSAPYISDLERGNRSFTEDLMRRYIAVLDRHVELRHKLPKDTTFDGHKTFVETIKRRRRKR